MLKRAITMALAAVAALAVSAPAASASWYKHHSVIAADQTIELTGQWKKSSLVVGSIECQVRMKVQLLAGQTTAEIEEFGIDPGTRATERCVTGGPLGPCDVTSFTTDASTQTPWIAHILQNKDTIEVTTGTGQTLLEGADSTPTNIHTACNVVQSIQTKPGKVHWTIAAGETCTINHVSVSGQQETQTGAKVTMTGTLEFKPKGTYGTTCF